MTTLTITSKGQVTLKQDLLKHLGVMPGQKVEVIKLPDGGISVRGVTHHKGSINQFIGCLAEGNEKTVSIEEMNAAIAQGWANQE